MEKINFNYSMKNIPVPSNSNYKLKLIEKVELLIKRMRWRAHFFLNEKRNDTSEIETEKENYGFLKRNKEFF